MRISDWSSDVCSSDPFSFGTNSGAGVSDIETLGSELLAEVAAADNLEAVEAVRVKALGKQGQVTALLKRSEEHTYELQSLMRISYAVFCLKKNNNTI